MAAKKKARKKTARAETKVVDPRAPVKPTPAALREALEEVRSVLPKIAQPEEPVPGDLVYAMVHAFFAEGLADGVAQEVLRRIENAFVDRNEFRVTEAFEVADLLRDLEIPDLLERCLAVQEAVGQVYNDQNSVSLDLLREASVTERNQFFQRVPAIAPHVSRFLISLISFEECIFSDRSTIRVQMRLGLDPKASAVQEFFSGMRELITPYGHIPLTVGPDSGDGRPTMEPVLSPASVVVRLSPGGKKK